MSWMVTYLRALLSPVASIRCVCQIFLGRRRHIRSMIPFNGNFRASSGSSSVVHVIGRPGGLVQVAVDVFFHLRDLYVVGSLGDEDQDVCHAISFVGGVMHVS